MAVAWAIADRTTVSDGGTSSEQECKDLAGLVAKLSRMMLASADSRADDLHP